MVFTSLNLDGGVELIVVERTLNKYKHFSGTSDMCVEAAPYHLVVEYFKCVNVLQNYST